MLDLIAIAECVELVCDGQFMKATNISIWHLFAHIWLTRTYRTVCSSSSKVPQVERPAVRCRRQRTFVKKITQKHGATGFSLAKNEREASDLWTDRKNAGNPAGARGWMHDVW